MKFSIILPTYNRGYILWKTIQSVQKQTYPNWELLIIDDGSTDNTQQVVAEFQSDPRITYHKIKNGGVARARNIGMEKATGDIITYLDSDDIFYDNFISTAYEIFSKYPEKVFAIPNYNFRAELYDKNYKLVDFSEMELRQTNDVTLKQIFNWEVKCAFGTGLLHKKEIIKTGIRWDSKLKLFDDWDFALQLGTAFPNGFIHIPFVLYEYIQRYGIDGHVNSTTYAAFAKGFEAIYQKHKHAQFMQNQTWHPRQVSKYVQLQKEFNEGKAAHPVYKYFPEYFKKKNK